MSVQSTSKYTIITQNILTMYYKSVCISSMKHTCTVASYPGVQQNPGHEATDTVP